jgi:hypothetical protein
MLEIVRLQVGQYVTWEDFRFVVTPVSPDDDGKQVPYRLVEPSTKDTVDPGHSPEHFNFGTFVLDDGTTFEPSQLPRLANRK